MNQHVHALTASEAQIAIDHLESLINSLKQKQLHLEHLKSEATRQAVRNEEPKVFYSYGDRGPTQNLMTTLSGLRVGKTRKIDRYIQVDPIWAARVLKTSPNPEDCFRLTESEDSARGVLSLHSLI
jgi:hypothetical protein